MSANRRLALQLLAIWIVLVVVGSVIIAVLPFPPGKGSSVGESISDTLRLLTWLAWPIFSGTVLGIVGSTLIGRRDPNARPGEPDRLRGNPRVAGTWVGVVGLAVLALAVFGTLTLTNEEAAQALGVGGRGTEGAATGGDVTDTNLEVQVIAQQWQFTFRYPGQGGFESAQLVMPVGAQVTFHVTSLDVVHSFWLIDLGVKADAVPNNDNVFSTRLQQIGTYRLHCAELCGLWHGAMSDNTVKVVSQSDFKAWASQQLAADGPIMKFLPPYSHTYVPDPLYAG